MPDAARKQARFYLMLPNGEQEGPYSLTELHEMLRRELINADTQVREDGTDKIQAVDELLNGAVSNAIDDITGLSGLSTFSLRHFFCHDVNISLKYAQLLLYMAMS